jgi:hypothetical protein
MDQHRRAQAGQQELNALPAVTLLAIGTSVETPASMRFLMDTAHQSQMLAVLLW